MTFSQAIEAFIADWAAEGRLNGPNSDQAYRRTLGAHCDDVGGADPATTTKDDVRRTLARWPNPNSRRLHHSVLRTFYDWCTQEGVRLDNPARQLRAAKPRQPVVFRPTREEVVRLLDASTDRRRDRWVIHLGVLAGLRRAEFCGLQGRHLSRDGFVWVSADIGKGGKERFMPVLPELEPVVAEIRDWPIGLNDYVLGHMITTNPPFNTEQHERRNKPISPTGLYKLVQRVGRRAGLASDIGPHTLRHAYGDHVARFAGLKVAQALLGHTSVETTETNYTGRVTLDELAVSVHGFSYRQTPTAHRTAMPHGKPDAR